MSEIEIRLWERAEAAIEKVVKERQDGGPTARVMAKAATLAVLSELADEVADAEEDNNWSWPDSGDLSLIADALEEAS